MKKGKRRSTASKRRGSILIKFAGIFMIVVLIAGGIRLLSNPSDSQSDSSASCEVSFDCGSEDVDYAPETQTVAKNGQISCPPYPVREGYVFGGWYLDQKCKKEYDFTSAVTKSFTLYALWYDADSEEAQLTDEEEEFFVQCAEQIQTIGNSVLEDGNLYHSESQAEEALDLVAEYAGELLEEGTVTYYNREEDCVYVEFASRIIYLYMPREEGTDSFWGSADSESTDSQETQDSSECESISENDASSAERMEILLGGPDEEQTIPDSTDVDILCIQPFDGMEEEDDNREIFNTLCDRLIEEFNDMIGARRLDRSESAISDLRNVPDCDILLWHGHGAYTEELGSMLVSATSATMASFSWYGVLDLFNGIAGTEKYCVSEYGICISSDFVNKYFSLNNESGFVYLAACDSLKDTRLAEAFAASGAEVVIGTSETLDTWYDQFFATDLIRIMSGDYDGIYHSVEEAMEITKDLLGSYMPALSDDAPEESSMTDYLQGNAFIRDDGIYVISLDQLDRTAVTSDTSVYMTMYCAPGTDAWNYTFCTGIKGTVIFEDETQKEELLGSIWVELVGEDGSTTLTRPDSDGVFYFNQIDVGTYHLELLYQGVSVSRSEEIQTRLHRYESVEISFDPSAKMEGYVYDEYGQALDGVTVSVLSEDGLWSNEVQTDSDGYYSSGCFIDTYTLTYQKSGYVTQTQSVTVPESAIGDQAEAITLEDVDMERTIVYGRVVDSGTQEAISDVSIQFVYLKNLPSGSSWNRNTERQSVNETLQSGTDGKFQKSSTVPGIYQVTLTKDGYKSVSLETMILDSADTDLGMIEMTTTVQVIFTQEMEFTGEQQEDGSSLFESLICKAVVEVPGRAVAQAAIQEMLDEIYEAHQNSSAELLTYAQNSSTESNYASQYEGCFIGAYVSGQALSLEDYTFSYAGGAVHENSSRDQYNFDLKSGALLSLGDIVADDAALEELILTQMSEDRESIESFTGSDLESVAEKALSSERTTGWYLDADGFHLYFDYYEIGSYAMGASDYLVSYDLLEGVLLEEYLPISALSPTDREAVEIVSASEVSADEFDAVYGLTGSQECAISSITVYDLYIMSAAAAEENDGTGLLSDTVMLCYASVMHAEDQIYLDADDGQEIIIAYS